MFRHKSFMPARFWTPLRGLARAEAASSWRTDSSGVRVPSTNAKDAPRGDGVRGGEAAERKLGHP
jgi:hypothetical protein